MIRYLCAVSLVLVVACAKEKATPETAGTSPSPAATREMTVVYSEDFSSPATGWPRTVPEGPVQTDYRDGQYVVSIDNTAKPFGVAPALASTEFDDVSVEVDAKSVEGDGRGSIGVICRASNAGYYFADINPATARIGMYAKEQEILSETNAPDVWKTGEVNRLRFDCIGDKLNFQVNGQQILAGADARLPIGKIGVIAGGTKEGKLSASFDNLVVKKP